MAAPPTILYTDRLVLRLNDPDSQDDCEKLIRIYNDDAASLGGNARVGINTADDIRAKHRAHGPKQKYCTKSAVPRGLYHLVFLKTANEGEGELVGLVGMSFRDTMPYPDLGYALFGKFWGKGYASEAGREALKWWRDVIGVEEVWAGALEKNARSQRCAENIGFVRSGEFDVCFGKPGAETWATGVAYVLPGMEWKRYDENGKRRVVRPTVGNESEKQKQDPLNVG